MSAQANDAESFMALTEKISRERGFGTASYKDGCLRRRIAVRMRANRVDDYTAYSQLLDSDPLEFDRLLDALTINVTKLFRNNEVWDAVAASVLPVLWTRVSTRIQNWVAGCASGEEAYTLAALWHRHMTTHPAAGAPERVRITASDIDRRSLIAAELGAFGQETLTETPDTMRARYFARVDTDGRAHAAQELRDMIRFERRDLLSELPPAGALHLSTCRNVIIYFDRPSQEALMKRFHHALAEGGFLVLGKVETLLGPSRLLFDVVDQRNRIFRRA